MCTVNRNPVSVSNSLYQYCYRLSLFCAAYVALSCPIPCKLVQKATYFLAAGIFFPFLIGRFSGNPFLCKRTNTFNYGTPYICSTIHLSPYPRNRRGRKPHFMQGRPSVRVRDPFRGRRQILFPARNPFRLRTAVCILRMVYRQPDLFQ